MTSAIVDGLRQTNAFHVGEASLEASANADGVEKSQDNGEPMLEEPKVGNPISRTQIVSLWRKLKESKPPSYNLEQLLCGSQVYCPPPPPKPEPSEEYKALMARLRHEEAQRAYERMVNPLPKIETFNDRFPTSAQAYFQVNRPVHDSDLGDDDVTLQDVHRQVMLIINFMVSILGVAGTLWVTSKWWSLPARIFLTMGGSIVVAIAEIAVYSGYMWRMEQGKQKQKKAKEVKHVVNTWTVGLDEKEDSKTILLRRKVGDPDETVRKRVAVVQ